MGRPFYPHEAEDADLDWLVTNFLYERSDFIPVETEMLPLILMPYHEAAGPKVEEEVGILDLAETDKVGEASLSQRRQTVG